MNSPIKSNNWLDASAFIIPLLLITILNFGYGLGFRFDESKGLYFNIVSGLFLMPICFAVFLGLRNKIAIPDVPLGNACTLIILAFSLVTLAYFYSDRFTLFPWYLSPILSITACYIAQNTHGIRARNYILAFLTLSLYTLFYINISHDDGANMLLIIEEASKDIAQGTHPYRYYPTASSVPFIYLPGTWLPYIGLDFLGIDYRVFNILNLVIILGVFEYLAPKNEKKYNLYTIIFYPVLISVPIAQMIIHGHIWLYWTLLILTVLLIKNNKIYLAAFILGLCLATRQPALFFAAPLAVYIYINFGFKNAIQFSAICSLTFLACLAPVSLWSGQGFWHWYLPHSSSGNLSKGSLTSEYPGFDHITASSYFYLTNTENLLIGMQALTLLLTCIAIYLTKTRKLSTSLFLTGTGFLLFVAFNSYVARYLYIPGILLIATGLVFNLQSQRNDTK